MNASHGLCVAVVVLCSACRHPAPEPVPYSPEMVEQAMRDALHPELHSYMPPDGYVPDSATAARIAEAVWIPIYGADNIRRQRPYGAVLRDSVWTVFGYLPPNRLGGVAIAEISRRDGRILRVSHGR